jgi:mRNA interferase MazF
MLRGEIWLADLSPARGSEASQRRPVVVVSNDGANRTAERLARGVITVVPITSNVQRVYPFQTFLPSRETGLERRSKAQAEQIRSIDVARMGDRVGALPARLMRQLDAALRLHLGL